jgi:S-adenosylmethionine synthetase
MVIVAGEITTEAYVDVESLVRQVVVTTLVTTIPTADSTATPVR